MKSDYNEINDTLFLEYNTLRNAPKKDEQKIKEQKDKIVLTNIGLIHSVVRHYINVCVSYTEEDLFEEGILGLMKAVDLYDMENETKFSTYATFWIRAYIIRAIKTNDRIIRIPECQQALLYRYFRLKRENNYTTKECADVLKVSVNILETLETMFTAPRSMDEQLSTEDDDFTLLDTVPDASVVDFNSMVVTKEAKEELRVVIDNTLMQREAFVIKMRFGFIDGEMHTLETIGKELGTSKERVRQIEAKSIRKLRYALLKKTIHHSELESNDFSH